MIDSIVRRSFQAAGVGALVLSIGACGIWDKEEQPGSAAPSK
jgi:hypothetical protein